ncbi:hypothetical protein ACS3SW_00835 [Roseobacteraceae bacterium S113]
MGATSWQALAWSHQYNRRSAQNRTSGKLAIQANRAALHRDPKFLAIQPARDAAMDLLSGAHLFQSIDNVITLKTGSDYEIFITHDVGAVEVIILVLPPAHVSPDPTDVGKLLVLSPWSDADDVILESSAEGAEVFRVRFSCSAK